MKAGGGGLLRQGQLKRLLPAIERELREARRGRRCARRRDSFGTWLEHDPVGIIPFDSTGDSPVGEPRGGPHAGYGLRRRGDGTRICAGCDADSRRAPAHADRDKYTDRQRRRRGAIMEAQRKGSPDVQLSGARGATGRGKIESIRDVVRDRTDTAAVSKRDAAVRRWRPWADWRAGSAHRLQPTAHGDHEHSELLPRIPDRRSPSRADVEQVRKAGRRLPRRLTRQLCCLQAGSRSARMRVLSMTRCGRRPPENPPPVLGGGPSPSDFASARAGRGEGRRGAARRCSGIWRQPRAMRCRRAANSPSRPCNIEHDPDSPGPHGAAAG